MTNMNASKLGQRNKGKKKILSIEVRERKRLMMLEINRKRKEARLDKR